LIYVIEIGKSVYTRMETSLTSDEFSATSHDNDNNSTFSEVNDDISLEETVFNLKMQTHSVDTLFKQCDALCNTLKKKVEEGQEEPIQKTELIAKAALQKWLKKRKLNPRIKFQTFLDKFITEHADEMRCDISERTISLNKDAGSLLGIKEKDYKIHVLDLFQQLSELFE
jgi:hypothetical protein